MSRMNLMKMAAAMALLFAVNMNADAQFGKLKNLAKKKVEQAVREQVDKSTSTATSNQEEENTVSTPTTETETTKTTSNSNNNSSSAQEGYDEDGFPVRKAGESDKAFRIRSQRYFYKDNPGELEKLDVEEAGNMTNYFGITGGDEAVIIRYYELNPGDLKTSNRGDEDGYWAAQMIVNAWRYIKNPAADTGYRDDPATFKLNFIHNDIEKKDAKAIYHVKHAVQPFQKYKLMPKADNDAFYRVIKKLVADYQAKFGPIK